MQSLSAYAPHVNVIPDLSWPEHLHPRFSLPGQSRRGHSFWFKVPDTDLMRHHWVVFKKYPSERERLIAAEVILPLNMRPTLPLDQTGKDAAIRHEAEYRADPGSFEMNLWKQDPSVMP